VIGPEGGKLATPDGSVEVAWAPNVAREPQTARVWSIVAPGGTGFQIAGPAGPAKLTCWPPGSELSPGTAGSGDPVGAAPPRGTTTANDGGVEILGPDQEWTTVKNTLNRDGSRTIEFVDERRPLRKKGLVKGASGPYVIVPEKTTVLRGQSKRLKVVNQKKQQDEWKDAVKDASSLEDDELAPLSRTPGKTGTSPNESEDELAPLAPKKDAGTAPPPDDDLAPLTKTPGRTGDPDIDELAPLSPRRAPASGGTPAPTKP